jgi:hypothetical protein
VDVLERASTLNKSDLIDLAVDHGVDVQPDMLKADIYQALVEQVQAAEQSSTQQVRTAGFRGWGRNPGMKSP